MNGWWESDEFNYEFVDGAKQLERERVLLERTDPLPLPPTVNPRQGITDLTIQQKLVAPGEYIELTVTILPEEYIVTFKYPSAFTFEIPVDRFLSQLKEMGLSANSREEEWCGTVRSVLLSYRKLALFPHERMFRAIVETDNREDVDKSDFLPMW